MNAGASPTHSMTTSAPRSPVARWISTTGLTFVESSGIAPSDSAIFKRSAAMSTTKMRSGAYARAFMSVNKPTGPAPTIATVSPGLMPARSQM